MTRRPHLILTAALAAFAALCLAVGARDAWERAPAANHPRELMRPQYTRWGE